ncbi:MAG: ABC transporter permease subunit [Parvibaculaceae bacterium]
MAIDWTVVEMAVPLLAQGAVTTLQISACAIVIGTAAGVGLGMLALGSWGPARWFVRAYVDFIRGTPLLVQIFLVFFALPVLGIRSTRHGQASSRCRSIAPAMSPKSCGRPSARSSWARAKPPSRSA